MHRDPLHIVRTHSHVIHLVYKTAQYMESMRESADAHIHEVVDSIKSTAVMDNREVARIPICML